MNLRASPGRLPSETSTRLLLQGCRWVAVCWIVLFWRLDYVALIDDGAHYAQLTREMLGTGSWLVPLLDGAPYIDKPVLFHWLQGLSFQLLGVTDWAARLPSAVAAVTLFLITRFMGRRLFGADVADRAWLMLATVPATFVLGRVGYLDMTFTAFMFGSVTCLTVAALDERPRLQYVGYALLVLAVMTKGPVALVLVGLCFALAWFLDADCRRAIRALEWKTGLALVILGAAPWFIWMHGRFGEEFIQGYLMTGHALYLSPRASGSSAQHAFYLEMFVTVFFPWSLVAIGYLVDTLRRSVRGMRVPTSEKFLWMWIASVLILFTAARFRVDRYIFPAAPACCLLAARAWLAAKRDEGTVFAATKVAIFTSAVTLVVGGVLLGARLPGLELSLPGSAYLLPGVLVSTGLAIVAAMLRHRLRPPTLTSGPIAALVGVYGLVVAMGFPLMEELRPTRRVGHWLKEQIASTEPIGLYALDAWQPALRYYGTRKVQLLGSEEDVRSFLDGGDERWIVTRRDMLDRLEDAPSGVEVAFTVPAVVGTKGTGIRRQVWGDIVVARRTAHSRRTQPLVVSR
jgi:4-amino-4-deoxy-L-arabinose transferase-like glycosyltransferase